MMSQQSMQVVTLVVIGIGGLGLGFLIGAVGLRFLLRDVRVQYLKYLGWGMCHRAAGPRLARALFATGAVLATAGVQAAFQSIAATVAVASLAFGLYQLARRGSQRWVWFSQMAELGRVWSEDPEAFEHLALRVIYYIGSDRRDRWTRIITIRALKPMILMKGVHIGATQGSGTLRKFSRMAISAWARKGEVTPVPASAQPTTNGLHHELCLIMSRPMSVGEDREIIVSGTWRDQWGPLRAKGHDEGVMQLARTVRHLEIAVVFPRGMAEKDCRMTRLGPSQTETAGTVAEGTDNRGRVTTTWRIESAQPGEYRYAIDCVGLKQGRRE